MMISKPWGISEERIQQALAQRLAEDGIPVDMYETLRLFQNVCSQLLRVSTGDEAIALLVSSSRVMQDISHAMDHGQNHWDMSVVARVWDPAVRLEREFRAFVVAGRVRALTQYDDQLCHSQIMKQPEHIIDAILQGFCRAEHGLQRLKLMESSAAIIIDFLVAPASAADDALEARIIELNPFGPMTGASLFTWTGDRRLLQGGLDLYGDLDAWEQRNPPTVSPGDLPACVTEICWNEVHFRFLHEHSPNFRSEHLQVFWEDYNSLLPQALEAAGVAATEVAP